MPTATRRLILIRHAKAVEDDPAGDHARPLNARGLTAAAELGAWLRAQQIVPQMVLCSTAIRTRQTLEAFGYPLPVTFSDKLYLATAGDVLSVIQAADDTVTDLMLIGHNPGLHVLLASLVDTYAHEEDSDRLILKFPTAATAVLRTPAKHWGDVSAQSAHLETLRY